MPEDGPVRSRIRPKRDASFATAKVVSKPAESRPDHAHALALAHAHVRLPYSARSARIGSTAEARRAGM